MKKVVFIIHSLNSGGSENLFLHILPNIQNANITLITLRYKGPLYKKYLELGIKVVSVDQKSFFDLKSYRRARKIFDKIKPDLVVTNLFHADLFGRIFVRYFLNYPTVPYLVSTLNFNRYLPIRVFERLTKYFVPHYIANSHAVKESYINNYKINPSKIAVIQNGLDLERFNINVNDRLTSQLGIKNDRVIICVANLHPSKGHTYLLEAFEKVFKTHKNVQLLIVGDGVEKDNLINQVKDYASKDNIKFLGQRSDVPEILKLSDIFVLPTFFEGLSVAIMEAMASQLAIITTNIPENRELIKNNFSGLLCPVGDSKCLARKIEYLISHKKQATQLATNALNTIKKDFIISVIIKKWEKYIRDYEIHTR